jgi:pimeloyl-ACP methyl ester carboxylesterase
MNCPSCIRIGPRLHCTVTGEGAIPLLFLHGFAASSVTWDEITPYFPPDRYRLYLLDLKGSGNSAKPRDHAYSPDDQALLVLDTISGLGLRNLTLVGHSLGGGIALLAWHRALATGCSSLISRLVLIDAAAYRQPFPRFFRWLRTPVLGWALLTLLPLRTMVSYNLRHVYHDPAEVTEERIKRYMECFRGPGTVAAILATARQVDASGSLPDHCRISLPTLIIWGRYDRVVRPDCGDRLHSEIHGSRLVVLECGHNPHEEEAAACAAAILAFMEDTL